MPSEQDIYQEHVLDHYEDPCCCGPLPDATHSHEGKNTLCGDVIQIHLKISEDGQLEDARFEGEGCVITLASASMLMEEIDGKGSEELREFGASNMLELFGARLTPNRQKCCLLPWRVLQTAIHSPINDDENCNDTNASDG